MLFHLAVTTPIADVNVTPGSPATNVNLNTSFDDDELTGTIVRMVTNAGNIDLELFNQQKPTTVTNFLNYVNSGRYNNTIFHRRTDPTTEGIGVIQGGGYTGPNAATRIQTDAPIPLEVQTNGVIPNSRGTIAMARTNQPNSATSEFFINNTDNNSALGPNNGGGYAVFGRVIGNTLSTVDAIAALPRINATDPADPANTGAFGTLPVLNAAAGAAAENLVRVTTASAVPEIAYEVVGNTRADLVTPTITNGTLTLNYAQGVTGSSDITIRATDVLGNTTQDTFTVNVLSGNEVAVVVGDTGTKQLTFTDADGTNVKVTYKGGSATVRLVGSGLAQEDQGNKGVNVTGTGIDLSSIAITGATAGNGALTITGKGGNDRVNVGSITSDGSLKSISAKQVALTNGMNVTGSVGKLDLLRGEGGTINITGNGPLSMTADVLADTDVTVGGALKSLKLNAYNETAGGFRGITAQSVGKISVANDYQGNLTSFTTFGGAKVGGGVGGGAWNVGSGTVGKITAGSIAPDWSGAFSGPLSGLTVGGDMGGSLSAPSAKSIAVKGNLQNATLTFSEPFAGSNVALGKLAVGGTISDTTVRTPSSIGSVTADAMAGSKIYAGVNPAPFLGEPSVPVDKTFFVNEAGIKSVSLKGKSAVGITNSNIAAPSLGKIALGTVDTAQTGLVLFGIAADRIASLTGQTPTAAIKLSNLDDPAEAQQQIAALGGLGDFVIRVF